MGRMGIIGEGRKGQQNASQPGIAIGRPVFSVTEVVKGSAGTAQPKDGKTTFGHGDFVLIVSYVIIALIHSQLINQTLFQR